jgi:hypothetical protein
MTKQEVCERYLSIKNEMKALEIEEKELKKELLSEIEDEYMRHGSASKKYGAYSVSVTEQRRILADAEALKEAGIFEKYSKPSIATIIKVIKK